MPFPQSFCCFGLSAHTSRLSVNDSVKKERSMTKQRQCGVQDMKHDLHVSNLLVGGLLALNATLAALLRHDESWAAAAELSPGVTDPGAYGVGGRAALPMVPKGVGTFRTPTGVSRSAMPRGVSEAALPEVCPKGGGVKAVSASALLLVAAGVFSLSAEA